MQLWGNFSKTLKIILFNMQVNPTKKNVIWMSGNVVWTLKECSVYIHHTYLPGNHHFCIVKYFICDRFGQIWHWQIDKQVLNQAAWDERVFNENQ